MQPNPTKRVRRGDANGNGARTRRRAERRIRIIEILQRAATLRAGMREAGIGWQALCSMCQVRDFSSQLRAITDSHRRGRGITHALAGLPGPAKRAIYAKLAAQREDAVAKAAAEAASAVSGDQQKTVASGEPLC